MSISWDNINNIVLYWRTYLSCATQGGQRQLQQVPDAATDSLPCSGVLIQSRIGALWLQKCRCILFVFFKNGTAITGADPKWGQAKQTVIDQYYYLQPVLFLRFKFHLSLNNIHFFFLSTLFVSDPDKPLFKLQAVECFSSELLLTTGFGMLQSISIQSAMRHINTNT